VVTVKVTANSGAKRTASVNISTSGEFGAVKVEQAGSSI
jgi:hypothetical protein